MTDPADPRLIRVPGPHVGADWNAAALPWKLLWMLAGNPICCSAARITLTASPRETFGRMPAAITTRAAGVFPPPLNSTPST